MIKEAEYNKNNPDKNSVDYLIGLVDKVDDKCLNGIGLLSLCIMGDFSGSIETESGKEILFFENRKEMFEKIIAFAKDNGVEV